MFTTRESIEMNVQKQEKVKLRFSVSCICIHATLNGKGGVSHKEMGEDA